MKDNETTYIPFEDGLLIQQHRVQKCEVCGANMNANCHAHASYCPYHCKDDEQQCIPVGSGLSSFLLFLSVYIIWKFKIK